MPGDRQTPLTEFEKDLVELIRKRAERETLASIAERAGVKPTNLSAWMHGRRTISKESIIALGEAVGVRLRWVRKRRLK